MSYTVAKIDNARVFDDRGFHEGRKINGCEADFNFSASIESLGENNYRLHFTLISANIDEEGLNPTPHACYTTGCDKRIQYYFYKIAWKKLKFNVGDQTIDCTDKLQQVRAVFSECTNYIISDFQKDFTSYKKEFNTLGVYLNFQLDTCGSIFNLGQSFSLTQCNQAPTISDYDRYLGEKNKAFSVDYTVWDEDNDRLSVSQRLNYDTIGDYSNVASGTSSTIYITDDMLKRLPLNQRQYIYISVDDGKGGKATRTLSFTRTNSTPTISGYDMDLGDKNVGFSMGYTVSDADNDRLAITETLNGQVLNKFSSPRGQANFNIVISNEQLYKTPLNQKSTLIITANDGKGGISKRTYTFTRTNTPVAIGIIKKTYPTITFRCTDSNPSGYVTRADIYINNNYIQAFTSGFNREIEYTIDFSYLNEGNNTLMIRATNNQNITSTKNLNINKKSLKEPEIGTDIIVKGKKYQIINKKVDRLSMTLVLNKPLQEDVSKTDRIEILNDYCKVFAKTDENNELEEMQFIKSKDLGNGYTQERYQLDVLGRKVTTRVNMYGNTAINQIKEAFQYLED